MQAYRSTSSVLSSGSKLWLQQATCAEFTTNARLSPSPSVIQSVSRHIHSNVGQYLPPSHLPSHGLQQQAKSLFLGKNVKILTFIFDRESDGIVVSYVMGILEELADEV